MPWSPIHTNQPAVFLDTPTRSMGEPLTDGTPIWSPHDRCTRCEQSGLSELGRLQLKRQLGVGGFGVVWLAEDPVLKRQVALKLPRGPAFATPSSRKRFLREAQAAAGLRHANIVPVYGAGEADGICYVTLAYCSGPTLAQWLQQRNCGEPADRSPDASEPPAAVAPTTAARIVHCLASAVDHAHQRGVLHRDIKPGNVLLEPNDRAPDAEFPFTPMLSDFGLALLAWEDGNVTASGVLVGTPQYMAPEQASAGYGKVGPATDVYGLGTILYELLTGEPPVQGANCAEALIQVVESDPVEPRQRAPKVPRDLEAVCQKCLQKSPGRRYPSAAALADDLARFLSGEPTFARPVTRAAKIGRWAGKHPAAAGLVLLSVAATLLSIAGLAAYNVRLNHLNRRLNDALLQTQSAEKTAQQSERRAQELLYVSDIKLAVEAAKNQDVRQMQQLLERHRPDAARPDRRGIEWHYLWRQGHTSHALVGRHRGDVYFLAYSPDGRRLAAAGKDASIRIYDAQTNDVEMLLDTQQSEVNGLAFSPDGKRLASAGDDGTIRVWNLADRRQRIAIRAYPSHAYQVAFTSDGRLVSCGQHEEIRLWDAETGEPAGTLCGHQQRVEAIGLLPNARLVSVSSDGTARIWDLQSGREAARPWAHADRLNCLASSSDGRLLALASNDGCVSVFRLPSCKVIRQLHRLDGVHSLAFSSDGRLLSVGDRSGTIGLWKLPYDLDLDPKDDRPSPDATWMAHDGRVWSLAFSPDGKLVSAGGDGEVRRWLLTAAETPRYLDLQHNPVEAMVLAPPGKSLLTAGPQGLFSWDLADLDKVSSSSQQIPLAEPTVLHRDPWRSVAVTHDGRFAAAGNASGAVGVWQLPEGRLRATWRIDAGACLDHIALTPDGSTILAVDSGHDGAVWMLHAVSGEVLARVAVRDCLAASLSPDGRRLAVGRGNDVIVFGTGSLQQELVLTGHVNSVRQLAFSPDGSLLASAGADRNLYFWDMQSGSRRFTLCGHRGTAHALAFAPDGRSLVAGDDAGVLKVWNVATGQELCDLDRIVAGYQDLIFLPDACQLLCRYNGSEVRLLDWRPN